MKLAHRRIRLGLVTVGLALTSVLGACSSDGDGAADPSPPTTAGSPTDPVGDPAGGSTDGDGATIPGASMDDVPLSAYGFGIERAMGAEKVEIEGTTVHVYLAADNTKVPEGTECIVVGAVLPDGATAVIHRGGTETPC